MTPACKTYHCDFFLRGGLNSSCKIGYMGRMCNICDRNASDGNQYGRSSAF